MTTVTFGLDTFGAMTVDLAGNPVPAHEVIRNIVAEAKLADEVGVDHFGLGEHHRVEFAVPNPELVLAGIATVTSRITLGSAVTVLSSDDPVRVFEAFSELDALSNGRAEVVLGRGSFIESFPLFGYSLSDYEELFEEKLELWHALLDEGPVTWAGRLRSGLKNQHVYPKTAGGKLTTWVAVGGSPESVVRAARYGLPLMLAIIGGAPVRFTPFVDLYHRALAESGQASQPVSVHSPGFVAPTDEEAVARFEPYWSATRAKIGAERGWGPPRPDDFRNEVTRGALHLGSPQTVAHKIAATIKALGIQRFDLKYDAGMPHEYAMESIELYGTTVIPMVKDLLA
jgi:probable LLM family oxidoreductase